MRADNEHMCRWADTDVLVLAKLFLQNERSLIVRRCVQRFTAGEITAREAVERIRRRPSVRYDDRYPDI